MRPDFNELSKMIDSAKRGYLSNMYARFDRMERLYDRQIALGVDLPADLPVYIPSTAPGIVDTFAAQIRTNDPRIMLGVSGRTSGNKDKNTARVAFGEHVLQLMEEYEDEPTWEYLRFSLASLGAACVRVGLDMDRWPVEAADQKDAWPFIFKVVHPKQVIIPAGFRWPYPYVIEMQRRTYAEILQQYPDFKPSEQWMKEQAMGVVKRDSELEIYFWWDDKDYVVYSGGHQLSAKKHNLGFPPYVWMFSRLGHKANDSDPDDQAVGVLRHVEDELRLEAELTTYAGVVWRHTAIPTLKGTVPEAQMARSYSAKWGRYVNIENAETGSLEYLEPPSPNQHAFGLLNDTKASIEAATLADVLTGASGDSRAASQYGFQVGQARLKTNTVRQSLERMAGRVIATVGSYYANVLEAGPRTATVSVSAEHLKDFVDYQVRFETVEPSENSQRVQDGLALLSQGALPWAHIAEKYFDISDPQHTWVALLGEQMIRQLIDSGIATQALLADAQNAAGVAEAAQDQVQSQITEMTEGVLGGPPGAPRGAPFGDRLAPGGVRSGLTSVDAL